MTFYFLFGRCTSLLVLVGGPAYSELIPRQKDDNIYLVYIRVSDLSFVNVNWLKKVIFDRLVTKNQVLNTKCQPEFFVVVSFQTEKRPDCSFF